MEPYVNNILPYVTWGNKVTHTAGTHVGMNNLHFHWLMIPFMTPMRIMIKYILSILTPPSTTSKEQYHEILTPSSLTYLWEN
jgi:hypothetical protein